MQVAIQSQILKAQVFHLRILASFQQQSQQHELPTHRGS